MLGEGTCLVPPGESELGAVGQNQNWSVATSQRIHVKRFGLERLGLQVFIRYAIRWSLRSQF